MAEDTKAHLTPDDDADEPIVARRVSRSSGEAKAIEGNWPPPQHRRLAKQREEEAKADAAARAAARKARAK